MRAFRLPLSITLAVALVSAADWPMPGGNPQHNGWAGSERLITKANVGQLKLLYRVDAGNVASTKDAPTSPMVVGNLITYRGFKEMLMFTHGEDNVFSIDADLNRVIWKTHLPDSAQQPVATPGPACPGGITAPVITEGSSSSSLHFAGLASRPPAVPGQPPPPRRNPYLPPLAESVYPLLPTTLTKLNAVYTVSSDGYVHVLNSSTGEDLIPAARFLPPGTRITGLNLRANTLYATTSGTCTGQGNALYSIDLLSQGKTVHSFSSAKGGFAGSEGATIGTDGTLYLQTAYAPADNPKSTYEAIVSLAPEDLRVKDYFILNHKPNLRGAQTGIAPVVFSLGDRDVIVAGDSNGHVYLLDSKSLGGTHHKTPLFASPVITKSHQPGEGFHGSFSTWFDVDTGIRRLYAPVLGGVGNRSGFPQTGASKGGDAVVAFALAGSSQAPTLKPLWAASGLAAPAPVVIGDGMIFVLSTGDPVRVTAKNGKQQEKPATLQVFEAATGKNLYESPAAPVSSPLSGDLTLASGRLYFSANDNSVYCFGIPGQHSQLTAQ